MKLLFIFVEAAIMRKRILFAAAILTLLTSSVVLAQGQSGGGGEVMGTLPVVDVRVESSADQLFFVGNDYVPNRITVTVFVRNSSPDTAIARGVSVAMIKDTRFIVNGAEQKYLADELLPGDEVSTTFDLSVADARSVDGNDTIRALFISTNAYSKTGEKVVWVQKEFKPDFTLTCTNLNPNIVFDDNINDYSPNPFTFEVTVRNDGDGVADSVLVQYIGVKYVSVFEQDSSRKFIGVLNPGQSATLRFQLRPARRSFDTTVNVCFQVTGIGGYKRKKMVDSCCTPVLLPAAKQADYQVSCDVVPDFIAYQDHKYNPNPFQYNVTVRNVGTALGKDVTVTLDPGPFEVVSGGNPRLIGDLAPGASANVSWQLRAQPFLKRSTVHVGVLVLDAFNNRGMCSDSVIVDSVRAARFTASCTGPDTLWADVQQGIYTNNPFEVTFTVCNIGSDYADSLKATMVIQSPSVQPLPGFPVVLEKAILTGIDTLGVDSCYTFRWSLEALPTGVNTPVRIKFKAQALNAEPVECELVIFQQKLDAPNLDVICETIPGDSVRFDPRTGGYFPPVIIFRATITNIGGGIAKNIVATLAPPPRTQLADGETWTKIPNPKDLGPNQSVVVDWLTVPVKRTDFGSPVVYRIEVTAENVEGSGKICSDTVFVPALPKTAAMAIPRNNVGYTNQLMLVPIYIDDPVDKDIKKIQVELAYNVDANRSRLAFDVLEFLDISTANSLANGWTIVDQGRNPSNDQLHFTIESPIALTYPPNTPPLLWLRFRAVFGQRPDDLAISSTPLLWPDATEIQSRILINDGSIFPLVTDGYAVVSGDCLRPLTASADYIVFNKPNPFNPTTTIQYTLPVDEHVRIAVYDALGRELEVLVNDQRSAGSYSVDFNAKNLPSGIYFYRFETPTQSQMKKMVVAK